MTTKKRKKKPTRKSARPPGGMTVAEAGRLGGEATRDAHGIEFYEKIGKKGGERVRELIAAARRLLGEER